MPYPIFDRTQLNIKPLSERFHDLSLDDVMQLDADIPTCDSPALDSLVERIIRARENGAPVMIIMGAHVIKRGMSRFIIDLMERGLVTHVGLNGAGSIHDTEFSLIGHTSESVARYIMEGQFGLWQETGMINEAAILAAAHDWGLGESIGRMIEQEAFPNRNISILAAGYRLKIPVTVHVGIGQDIIHEHPNFDGAAMGKASYRDFLTLAHTVSQLQGGVMLNIGTAVMGPEVYLKALSMARNVAHQHGEKINEFTTAVFDLLSVGDDPHREAKKTEAIYYFRPYKTILVRTVADGGESFYVQGDHRSTVSTLHHKLVQSLNAN